MSLGGRKREGKKRHNGGKGRYRCDGKGVVETGDGGGDTCVTTKIR